MTDACLCKGKTKLCGRCRLAEISRARLQAQTAGAIGPGKAVEPPGKPPSRLR